MGKLRFSLRTFLLFSLIAGLSITYIVNRYSKRESKDVPQDVLNEITRQYGYFRRGDTAQAIVETASQRALNVGNEQFTRAILFLSDGDLQELRRLADIFCLLYTSPSPRDLSTSRMPSSA